MGEKDHLKIKIGNRLIGSGEPAYLIAEMSANHAGSIERAKEIIHAAKESGADCIKIQTYTPDTLTIDCHNKYFQVNNGTWEGENLYSLYGKAYTPWEWQPQLKAEADKVGIDFLSTPFDNTAVDFLEDMGLEFYKIASFEMIDLPLVEYVASKGKPIIMSTGMATLEEIREAVETVYHTGNRQLVLLKCSSAYPADPAQMYLRTITDMQKRFDLPIGLSDHSMGSMSAVTAVALGASVIEKHFCLSREIVMRTACGSAPIGCCQTASYSSCALTLRFGCRARYSSAANSFCVRFKSVSPMYARPLSRFICSGPSRTARSFGCAARRRASTRAMNTSRSYGFVK